MTRTTKNGLYDSNATNLKRSDMKKRKEIIESSNARLVVSIHINKCPFEYRKGAQVFYKIAEKNSKTFANFLQKDLTNDIPVCILIKRLDD